MDYDLRSNLLLVNMDKTLVEQLANSSENRIYDPGELIIRQGERAQAFYVLVKGMVEVAKTSDKGVSEHVSSLSAPAFFGETGLMEEGRRTATVYAGEDSPVEVLVISRKVFKEFIDASEMMADEIAAMMQQHRIKDSLAKALVSASGSVLEDFASQAEVLIFSQGDKVICQGDPAEFFYILTRGRAEVLHTREDGRTYLINFHEPGEYFGEIGLMQNRPRSATVRAADESVEVLAFDRKAFHALLGDSLETETAIAQEVIERISRLTNL